MVLVSVDESIQQALVAAVAEVNQRNDLPKVHESSFYVGSDSTGERGIWIWLVLDDPAPGGYPRPTRDALREIVLQHVQGIPGATFAAVGSVYLSFQRKSEIDSANQWRGDSRG